jgi:hypothetical protein
MEQLFDFAVNLLLNAADSWDARELEGRQRSQQFLFPRGVSYAGGSYRTTAINPLFNLLQEGGNDKDELVALPGIEPGF